MEPETQVTGDNASFADKVVWSARNRFSAEATRRNGASSGPQVCTVVTPPHVVGLCQTAWALHSLNYDRIDTFERSAAAAPQPEQNPSARSGEFRPPSAAGGATASSAATASSSWDPASCRSESSRWARWSTVQAVPPRVQRHHRWTAEPVSNAVLLCSATVRLPQGFRSDALPERRQPGLAALGSSRAPPAAAIELEETWTLLYAVDHVPPLASLSDAALSPAMAQPPGAEPESVAASAVLSGRATGRQTQENEARWTSTHPSLLEALRLDMEQELRRVVLVPAGRPPRLLFATKRQVQIASATALPDESVVAVSFAGADSRVQVCAVPRGGVRALPARERIESIAIRTAAVDECCTVLFEPPADGTQTAPSVAASPPPLPPLPLGSDDELRAALRDLMGLRARTLPLRALRLTDFGTFWGAEPQRSFFAGVSDAAVRTSLPGDQRASRGASDAAWREYEAADKKARGEAKAVSRARPPQPRAPELKARSDMVLRICGRDSVRCPVIGTSVKKGTITAFKIVGKESGIGAPWAQLSPFRHRTATAREDPVALPHTARYGAAVRVTEKTSGGVTLLDLPLRVAPLLQPSLATKPVHCGLAGAASGSANVGIRVVRLTALTQPLLHRRDARIAGAPPPPYQCDATATVTALTSTGVFALGQSEDRLLIHVTAPDARLAEEAVRCNSTPDHGPGDPSLVTRLRRWISDDDGPARADQDVPIAAQLATHLRENYEMPQLLWVGCGVARQGPVERAVLRREHHFVLSAKLTPEGKQLAAGSGPLKCTVMPPRVSKCEVVTGPDAAELLAVERRWTRVALVVSVPAQDDPTCVRDNVLEVALPVAPATVARAAGPTAVLRAHGLISIVAVDGSCHWVGISTAYDRSTALTFLFTTRLPLPSAEGRSSATDQATSPATRNMNPPEAAADAAAQPPSRRIRRSLQALPLSLNRRGCDVAADSILVSSHSGPRDGDLLGQALVQPSLNVRQLLSAVRHQLRSWSNQEASGHAAAARWDWITLRGHPQFDVAPSMQALGAGRDRTMVPGSAVPGLSERSVLQHRLPYERMLAAVEGMLHTAAFRLTTAANGGHTALSLPQYLDVLCAELVVPVAAERAAVLTDEVLYVAVVTAAVAFSSSGVPAWLVHLAGPALPRDVDKHWEAPAATFPSRAPTIILSRHMYSGVVGSRTEGATLDAAATPAGLFSAHGTAPLLRALEATALARDDVPVIQSGAALRPQVDAATGIMLPTTFDSEAEPGMCQWSNEMLTALARSGVHVDADMSEHSPCGRTPVAEGLGSRFVCGSGAVPGSSGSCSSSEVASDVLGFKLPCESNPSNALGWCSRGFFTPGPGSNVEQTLLTRASSFERRAAAQALHRSESIVTVTVHGGDSSPPPQRFADTCPTAHRPAYGSFTVCVEAVCQRIHAVLDEAPPTAARGERAARDAAATAVRAIFTRLVPESSAKSHALSNAMGSGRVLCSPLPTRGLWRPATVLGNAAAAADFYHRTTPGLCSETKPRLLGEHPFLGARLQPLVVDDATALAETAAESTPVEALPSDIASRMAAAPAATEPHQAGFVEAADNTVGLAAASAPSSVASGQFNDAVADSASGFPSSTTDTPVLVSPPDAPAPLSNALREFVPETAAALWAYAAVNRCRQRTLRRRQRM